MLALMAFGTVGQVSAASIIYVKAGASGLNNGTSWANAYKSLQSALGVAVSGKQIWVAAGTYKPTTTTNRGLSFTLKNGVAVYGGFAGTETLLSQRNFTLHVTILSGDIGTLGVASDNSYIVVSGGGSGINSTAILDGFKIVAGNANCGCFPGDAGGGVFNWGSSPTLRNLTISNNSASGYGGGMYNGSGSPTLTNVTFSGNTTGSYGGGMYNTSSNPTLTNVTFSSNKATFFGYGGGMYNDGSSPKLTNVIFSSNTAGNNGGGMFNKNSSNPTLTDVTFSSNSAALQGGGMYNYTSSPKLNSVTFNSNSASKGGGMENDTSSPSLAGATFSGNSAGDGAGIENDSSNPTLKNVTFYKNSASNGGGMYNWGSGPSLTNTTFSGNTASLAGGGMDNENGSSPFIYDSIFWNDGSVEIWNTSPGLAIANSIVAGGCPGGSTCSNVFNVNPILGPLQNNGGFTMTMAPGSNSPAIDVGNNATCASIDQRGVTRPQGASCDMGAYEVKVMTFTSVATYDGWVLKSAKASNIGGSLNSTAATLRVGDDSSNRRYRSYLSFNTPPCRMVRRSYWQN